jgi:NAD(P)-dependent dehydrogenase (short-subunit alcohol dehydrogenase family)
VSTLSCIPLYPCSYAVSIGKLGSACCVELAAHGWEVIIADIDPPSGYDLSSSVSPRPHIFQKVDLEDMGQVMELLSGIDGRYSGPVDAVLHVDTRFFLSS